MNLNIMNPKIMNLNIYLFVQLVLDVVLCGRFDAILSFGLLFQTYFTIDIMQSFKFRN